jgi:hypothetical protein
LGIIRSFTPGALPTGYLLKPRWGKKNKKPQGDKGLENFWVKISNLWGRKLLQTATLLPFLFEMVNLKFYFGSSGSRILF